MSKGDKAEATVTKKVATAVNVAHCTVMARLACSLDRLAVETAEGNGLLRQALTSSPPSDADPRVVE